MLTRSSQEVPRREGPTVNYRGARLEKGGGETGSMVKPKRRKKKKTKGKQNKKGDTKDNSDETGGEETTMASPVATAQGVERDFDDEWIL